MERAAEETIEHHAIFLRCIPSSDPPAVRPTFCGRVFSSFAGQLPYLATGTHHLRLSVPTQKCTLFSLLKRA